MLSLSGWIVDIDSISIAWLGISFLWLLTYFRHQIASLGENIWHLFFPIFYKWNTYNRIQELTVADFSSLAAISCILLCVSAHTPSLVAQYTGLCQERSEKKFSHDAILPRRQWAGSWWIDVLRIVSISIFQCLC
jgi:hypothetical protein